VQSGIGATLLEARKRRKIELSEVEAATKIRAGYLRAIEAENWDALPGDAYARSFVRTYAAFLGLDSSRLAAQVPAGPAPIVPEGGARRGPARRTAIAAVCVALLGAMVAIGLVWGGGGGGGGGTGSAQHASAAGEGGGGGRPGSAQHSAAGGGRAQGGAMALSLTTTAELWVCLLDEDGKALVDGLVLPPGAEEGPFRSGSFTVSFGNGEVEMSIDGRESDIPQSASPLGYEVESGGRLSPLAESERPTCV
jgi:cytoskeleton protein RodZ